MKVTLLILASLIFLSPIQQEFVCLPCGYACDEKIHSGPGTCSECNMKLVPKSSVKFKNLSAKEFCERIEANPKALVIDVRSKAEFNGTSSEVESFGHFKDAININVNEFENKIPSLAKYKEREILVYCSHSHRSPRVGYLLGVNGFSNVKNLSEGVSVFSEVKDTDCLSDKFVFHTN